MAQVFSNEENNKAEPQKQYFPNFQPLLEER